MGIFKLFNRKSKKRDEGKVENLPNKQEKEIKTVQSETNSKNAYVEYVKSLKKPKSWEPKVSIEEAVKNIKLTNSVTDDYKEERNQDEME